MVLFECLVNYDIGEVRLHMLNGTTIVAVRKGDQAAIGGDGQVTFGQSTIMKHGAKKVRRLYQ